MIRKILTIGITTLLSISFLFGCSSSKKVSRDNVGVINSNLDITQTTSEPTNKATEEPVKKKTHGDSASERKKRYKEAKKLIKKKKFKEASEILQTLNRYRSSEFPNTYNLSKKIRILELARVGEWKETNKGGNQITVTGNIVKVNLERENAKYQGKISIKLSTPYKIAVKYKGKIDYIHVDSIFIGSIDYQMHGETEKQSLYSKKWFKWEAKYLKEQKKEEKNNKDIDDGKSSNEDNQEIIVTEPKKIEPRIGMSTSQVEKSSWGKPERKNITEYAWGKSEQWVYSNQRYIYFNNGIVTSIHRTE